MTYSLTPYSKTGIGQITVSNVLTTVQSVAVKAFRNVAVGATIVANGITRTVTEKVDEDTIKVSAAWGVSGNYTWTYTNPALVFTGIYYVKHTKNNKPTVTPSTLGDADRAFLSRGENGVYREIQLSGFIQASSIDEVIKNATILESFTDGTQAPAKDRDIVFLEEVPPRESYVWITSASHQISRDKKKWLDITVNMIERKKVTS
jgi:hypothetical protein